MATVKQWTSGAWESFYTSCELVGSAPANQLLMNPALPHCCRLAGYPPFSDDIKEYTLNDQILNARYSFQEKYWKGVSDQARDMIRRLLTLDPKSRITIPEAMDHPWLQDEEVVGRAKALIEQAQATPITPPTSSQVRTVA